MDPSRGNLALHDLLCRGTLSLVDEHGHLTERALNEALKSRSRGASRRALELAAKVESPKIESAEVRRGPGLPEVEEAEE
eukprot:6715654-Pyramimonas_sp.AAC.1